MPGKALIAHGTPDTLLMKSIQLVLVVHVMIFATDVAKGGLTNVAFVHRLGVRHGQMVAEDVGSSEAALTNVAFVGGH